MKLGVFTVLFSKMKFEEMLDHVKAAGLDAVEIGTGGYPGNAHCNPGELLADETKLKAFKKAVTDRGLTISALSCHGNALTPDKEFAQASHRTFLQTVELARKLEVPVVNTFSGTPGAYEGAKVPSWPVAPWPNEYREVLEWQWAEKIIPYWKEAGKFASDHGVKIALELHGGFSVHTPATLLRLREAVGEVIGANLDPSHLWWQGIDPVAAIKILGKAGAIHHFHAKDTVIDQDNVNMYGLTDMQSYANMQTRAWQFRTVGFGHGLKEWADILSALRLAGYDYVVSIEHEDALLSIEEGFNKAVQNLKQVLPREELSDMWWV
ncbi:sugar phosphate isomerase/epimerase family protein [Paenactinomyces guangxiensis]|uniref:Sugar phosphate isomerase/epimerase n=1 Tax=Paenactinomyces guangxiensis TaxID=1490290 RepID=A0A7W1WMW6_9BACL|nr:sugar phosphate isomerase/epimerase [Paenactinomyces guangxiensis]MBA4492848.1 sugar phosphate isomerase/epimerase [Paenactinomyces guangxiensis]MBH8590303.1 sugar phosphate isomerase/epimerase [Paenactinomyces guangxiensis]